MPNLAALLPDRFLATSSGLSVTDLAFNDATASQRRGVISLSILSGAHTRPVVLPNGSVFNPNQGYRSNKTLPILSFDVMYSYSLGTYTAEQADGRIEARWEEIENVTGAQGTLSAYRGTASTLSIQSAIEATAMLSQAATQWRGIKYDYSQGSGTPLTVLVVRFTFNLLTDWS